MKNWEKKKLGELSKKKDAVVSGPFGSNLKVSDYKSEGIPILRLQNIGKGFFIDKDIKFINEAKAEELKYHSFLSGDIALAKLGIPIGKTCIIPNHLNSGIITADIVRIRPDKNVVDYNFLEYFLNTDLSVNQLTSNISGATRPRVNLSDVRDIEIPLPPLPEQQRIVSILDEAFAAIAKAKANAEQNLKNAKELFESYLQQTFSQNHRLNRLNDSTDFESNQSKKSVSSEQSDKIRDSDNVEGWEEQLFENCFKLKSGDGLTSKNMSEDGEYPVFGGNGIAGLHDSFNLSGSNVIIGRVGALCGNVRHITENIWLTDNAFKVVDFKFDFDHSFLTYLLNYKNLRGFARQAAQPVISNSSLKDVVLEFPKSLKEQNEIVNKFDALSTETKKLEAIYQQKINDLEELKKSVLQKAFSGELKTAKVLVL